MAATAGVAPALSLKRTCAVAPPELVKIAQQEAPGMPQGLSARICPSAPHYDAEELDTAVGTEADGLPERDMLPDADPDDGVA